MQLRFFLLFFVCINIFTPVRSAEQKPSVSAEAFGQLENFRSLKLSPGGNRMASLRNFKGKISLVTQSMDPADKGRWYVIDMDEGEFNWFKWLTNDRLAISVRFPDRINRVKFTSTRLFALDWDKKNPINLVKTQRRHNAIRHTRVISQLQDNIISLLPDDPDHILLALDGDRQNYPLVYKINIHTAKRNRAVSIASHIVDWQADAKGVVRIGYGAYKSKSRIIYRETAESGWVEIAKYDAVDGEAPFDPVGFSPDPKIIYVAKIDENGFNAIYAYNYKTKEFIEKIISQNGADVTDLVFDRQGNIASYSYMDKVFHVVHLDKLRQRITRMTDKFFPDMTSKIISQSADKKKFIIKTSSPTNPGDYYFQDLNTNKIDWFSESYPGLDDEKLGAMKPVTYQARDGLDIPAYLSLPARAKDQKNLPTIIMPHGGPFARDGYGFDYWVQFLTTRGYAVLQMNYRGSTGLGNRFQELGHREWGGKMLDDINDGAHWMIERGYTNPKRICIVGGSYGGYAALQTLVKEPGLYKCAVVFAPVTNMITMFNNFKNFFGQRERYMPYIRNEAVSLSDISPYKNIDKINVPVLLVHGTNDRRVDYKHGNMFAKAMKRKKKNIRFVTLKEGDHHLSRQKHRIRFLKEMEKFLKKNL